MRSYQFTHSSKTAFSPPSFSGLNSAALRTLLLASRMHPQLGGRCFPSGIFHPLVNRRGPQYLASDLQQRECKHRGYSEAKTNPILNRKRMQVGCIYLHEDSVPNMAGPRCCYFKEERRKKSGRQRECMRVGMRLLHSRGHEARQCSPGYPSCQILRSPPLLSSAPHRSSSSFSLQPQPRSFFRKQKAGASILNPRDTGRPASFP